ncbi:Glycosyl hydrolases family 43 [Amycolatopsis arida]|uniref:Glycosyl hydrolases family 43 n=1 Tax=Amycolatopsis arida TaxID=587909 RepID=A0A1I5Z3Y8_9PSEU|nr:family 43 glycosylhydrolase [Amycolatopsis arida]TDX90118.1 glycosyl hydrolase family 43 [Amycolatopsis arida]SFQ51179.1 Glycosyl hydrolases family 43 [Amycolatopsis arida]
MRSGGRLGASALALVASAALVAGCTASTAEPHAEGANPGAIGGRTAAPAPEPPPPTSLAVDNGRESPGLVAAGGADAVYNYGPALMVEGSRVRMWWCSQYGSAPPAGDDILHAEAATPAGPFTGPGGAPPVAVLSGAPGEFDGVHTCDPSVLRVGGTYYLYYTGAAGDHAHGNAIGLATSTDGVHWDRAGAILHPAHDVARDNVYGAGQPAAVHLDGWFYLMFTDTTGAAAGWNGAGQFVLRSPDPTFRTGVQALGADGFTPAPSTSAPRTSSLVDAFSADLMWVDALDAFAIAHETDEGTTITFWDRDFARNPYHPVLIPGPWQEGPGLLRQPDGHAPVSPADPCGRVPLDVVRATVLGAAGAPTDLRHFGIDLHGVDACGEPERALAVLDGVAMPSPVRTMDLVTGGTVVRVERRSVAAELADVVLDRRLPVLDGIPVTARLAPAAPAVRADGVGTGLLLDDNRLWPVASARAVELNGSPIAPVTRQQWIGYPAGVVLDGR